MLAWGHLRDVCHEVAEDEDGDEALERVGVVELAAEDAHQLRTAVLRRLRGGRERGEGRRRERVEL